MSTTNSGEEKGPKRIETIARGVMHCAGHVLLCLDREGGYLYLPGGHVEPGEAASEALARELNEEAGLQSVRVGACALVTEQRFRQKKKRRHEINLVFHVEHAVLPDGTPLPLQPAGIGVGGEAEQAPAPVPSLESHIEFVWVESAALADLDLRPASFKAWLMSGSSGLDTPGWLSHME